MNRRRFLQAAPALAASATAAAASGCLHRLSNAPDSAVQLDTDGMLRVRGRREFILGLYQVPAGPNSLREAAETGFNLVHRSATRAAFDEASALGLRCWTALGSLPAQDRAAAEARLRTTVEALRDHRALLFWETEDEPTFVWKEPLRLRTPPARINATAALVRSIDPAHPLYLNHSPTHLVSTLQAYNPAADIVATDIYPVIPHGAREQYALWPDGRQGDFLNPTISQVGDYAGKMRHVAGPGRAVFLVLQAFAWEALREKDRDPSMVLYPDRAQLRFMAWQAVVHGANGLVWWGLSYTPHDAPLWQDLRTVVRELASVKDALAARPLRLPLRIEYHETGHSLDRGLEWTARPLGGDTLLVAVNADGNPVEATLSGLERFRRCEPVLGANSPAFVGGRLRERFEPFGARVWRLVG